MERAEKAHVEDKKGKLDLKKGEKRGDKIDQKKVNLETMRTSYGKSMQRV